MRTYMGYSIISGQNEGACLIFANSTKEAKKLAYPFIAEWFEPDWCDVGIKWLKEEHLQSLKKKDVPHVIDNPPCCPKCELWGGIITKDGCSNCGEV